MCTNSTLFVRGTSWNWNRVIGRRRGVVAVKDGGGDAAVDTVVNSLLNLQRHQAELSCPGAHLAMTSFLYIDWWRQLLRCKVKDICSAIWRNFSAAGSRHALPNKSKVRWWVWMMIRGVSVINWLSEKSEFCENRQASLWKTKSGRTWWYRGKSIYS